MLLKTELAGGHGPLRWKLTMRRAGLLLVTGLAVAGCGSNTKGAPTVQHAAAYRDGYRTAQAINDNQGVTPDAGSDFRSVCVTEASSSLEGVGSTHDNFDQWVQGCAAYLNLASSNTGNTGTGSGSGQ